MAAHRTSLRCARPGSENFDILAVPGIAPPETAPTAI